MNALQTRILNLLSSGIKAERAAELVNCSPSYISQLLSQEDFAAKVTDNRTAKIEALLTRDSNIDNIEDKIIDKVSKIVDSPFAFTKPVEAVKALQIINSLKRRAPEIQDTASQGGTVINLVLPASTVKNFTVAIDINSQITKINDTELVTIGTDKLNELSKQENISCQSLEQFNRQQLLETKELTLMAIQ